MHPIVGVPFAFRNLLFAFFLAASAGSAASQSASQTGFYPAASGRQLYYDGSNGILYSQGEDAVMWSGAFAAQSYALFCNCTTVVYGQTSQLLSDPAFPISSCTSVYLIGLNGNVGVLTAQGTPKGVACYGVPFEGGGGGAKAETFAHLDLFTNYNGYANAAAMGGWCNSSDEPSSAGPGFSVGCVYKGALDASVPPVPVDLARIWNPTAALSVNTGNLVHYGSQYLAFAFGSGPKVPTATQQALIATEMKAAGIDLSTYSMVPFKPTMVVLGDSDWHVDGNATVLCDPAHFADDMVSKAPYLLGGIYCGSLATATVGVVPTTVPTTFPPGAATPTSGGGFKESVTSNGTSNASKPASGVGTMLGAGVDLTDVVR